MDKSRADRLLELLANVMTSIHESVNEDTNKEVLDILDKALADMGIAEKGQVQASFRSIQRQSQKPQPLDAKVLLAFLKAAGIGKPTTSHKK